MCVPADSCPYHCHDRTLYACFDLVLLQPLAEAFDVVELNGEGTVLHHGLIQRQDAGKLGVIKILQLLAKAEGGARGALEC